MARNFTCCCSNTGGGVVGVGVERMLKSESAHLVYTAEQNFPAASARNGASDLSIMSPAL